MGTLYQRWYDSYSYTLELFCCTKMLQSDRLNFSSIVKQRVRSLS